MHLSGSLGSAHAVVSDSSDSSNEEDIMDEDMEETYVTTPQVSKTAYPIGLGGAFGSPAMSSLASFQQRQRSRKQTKKKLRGPLGPGFGGSSSAISKSPPSNSVHARRESISWQANQLHISGADTDDNSRSSDVDLPNGEGRSVTRRVVHRRGNLLPKTKTFARIRAALAEEGAPADAEFRREAEVVKQVRESDAAPEPRAAMAAGPEVPVTNTALSSPNMNTNQDPLNDIPEDDMMGELANGLSSSFKQQVMKNSKGKNFWDNFSDSGSIGGSRTTPPPSAFLPRGSSSGVSEDVAMDSPSLAGPSGFPVGIPSHSRAESQRSDTPQNFSSQNSGPQPPTAAEITRRINSKRRRDDDYFDPIAFKRRAVSPGLSVHNSPVMQSPLQRDTMSWGSRPGSNGGDRGGSGAQSDSGSISGTPANSNNSNGNSGGRVNSKGRIGFQGMVDTNDGIMRMSIE
jgi:hypothetical protein